MAHNLDQINCLTSTRLWFWIKIHDAGIFEACLVIHVMTLANLIIYATQLWLEATQWSTRVAEGHKRGNWEPIFVPLCQKQDKATSLNHFNMNIWCSDVRRTLWSAQRKKKDKTSSPYYHYVQTCRGGLHTGQLSSPSQRGHSHHIHTYGQWRGNK